MEIEQTLVRFDRILQYVTLLDKNAHSILFLDILKEKTQFFKMISLLYII